MGKICTHQKNIYLGGQYYGVTHPNPSGSLFFGQHNARTLLLKGHLFNHVAKTYTASKNEYHTGTL